MLKVTGPYLGGIEAIELLEKILEIIPKEMKTAEFINAYNFSES